MTDKLIQKIIHKIQSKNIRSIAIVMHNKPDGDCLGSAVALEEALKMLGKKVDLIIQDKINEKFSSIVGENRVNKIFLPSNGKKYDLLFMVDFSNPNRASVNVRGLAKYIIVLDHHINNRKFGDIYLNENVSATGILVYRIIKSLVPITPKIANCIYLSVRSDTSSFKNPNTDSLSHLVASQLLNWGASIELINNIYDSRSKEFVILMGETLSSIEIDEKYKVVYLVVSRSAIKSSGVLDEEVSFLIDQIRGIKDIDIAYLFVEGISNVRISARSKKIPIDSILRFFGGGGHPKAAGCAIEGEDILNVVDRVLAKTREHIDFLNLN